MKRYAAILLLAVFLTAWTGLSACGAAAQEKDIPQPFLWTFADPANGLTQIRAAEADEMLTLFLPSSTALNAVPLFFPGKTAVLTGDNGARLKLVSGALADLTLFPGDGRTEARCTCRVGLRRRELTVLRSENLDAAFLVSDDPVNGGRDWVESSWNHENRASGSLALLDPAGETVYSGALTQNQGTRSFNLGKAQASVSDQAGRQSGSAPIRGRCKRLQDLAPSGKLHGRFSHAQRPRL